MLPAKDKARLEHMLEVARAAVDALEGRRPAQVLENLLETHGLVRLVEIVGEAAHHVSLETRERAPTVPWDQAYLTRNRLSHGYANVNLDIVWATIEDDFPPLIEKLERLLASEEGTD